MKISKVRFSGIIILIIICACVIYNIYDNNRFKVVAQEITIDKLPNEFDGFKILQISDLHGKSFGENQKDLLKTINSLEYDMIAFTGDMNKDGGESLQDCNAIFTLIDGIDRKENMFWVDGNTAPFAIEKIEETQIGKLTEIGQILRDKGCKILDYPYEITRGDKKIWIVPEMSQVIFQVFYEGIDEDREEIKNNKENIDKEYKLLKQYYNELNKNGEVKIRLDHYPMDTNLSKEEYNTLGNLDYDLIIAGHYHGGQMRIPFYGALYIPSPTSGLGGYLPKQSDVKGLNYANGIPQYISTGLGSSSSIKFLGFRLFNTPEINVITLKCK